ncbi:LOW QUALITY PROTEIN: uncharacterized protein jeb [Palaemon carinicauda]|uniref:LOW QUALITY PROTEIN: uncharacterized protein jeb n=1 Tax=Palaemon carinicauda TaxID=392227 RepID=UPI0035B65A4A
MPQELPFLPLALLLAATLPAVCCLHMPSSATDFGKDRPRQYHWAYHRVANNDADRIADSQEIDGSRMRDALLQLLDLNDGELQALMSGVSARKVAPHLKPSTAFLLASSREYLERLNTVLSVVEESSPAKKSTWNPRIARRHKKARRNHKNVESKDSEKDHHFSEEDPDSILGALTELSEYLSGAENEEEEDIRQQERRRRSHHPGGARKHQALTSRHGSKYETRHYLYYLQSRECPIGSDGTRKRYCPTPYDSGEPECIEDMQLCDGVPQCPNEEDEAPTHCLFYGALKMHIDAVEKFVIEEQILMKDF